MPFIIFLAANLDFRPQRFPGPVARTPTAAGALQRPRDGDVKGRQPGRWVEFWERGFLLGVFDIPR